MPILPSTFFLISILAEYNNTKNDKEKDNIGKRNDNKLSLLSQSKKL